MGRPKKYKQKTETASFRVPADRVEIFKKNVNKNKEQLYQENVFVNKISEAPQKVVKPEIRDPEFANRILSSDYEQFAVSLPKEIAPQYKAYFEHCISHALDYPPYPYTKRFPEQNEFYWKWDNVNNKPLIFFPPFEGVPRIKITQVRECYEDSPDHVVIDDILFTKVFTGMSKAEGATFEYMPANPHPVFRSTVGAVEYMDKNIYGEVMKQPYILAEEEKKSIDECFTEDKLNGIFQELFSEPRPNTLIGLGECSLSVLKDIVANLTDVHKYESPPTPPDGSNAKRGWHPDPNPMNVDDLPPEQREKVKKSLDEMKKHKPFWDEEELEGS